VNQSPASWVLDPSESDSSCPHPHPPPCPRAPLTFLHLVTQQVELLAACARSALLVDPANPQLRRVCGLWEGVCGRGAEGKNENSLIKSQGPWQSRCSQDDTQREGDQSSILRSPGVSQCVSHSESWWDERSEKVPTAGSRTTVDTSFAGPNSVLAASLFFQGTFPPSLTLNGQG
jgi:hypothetical protein